MKKQMDSRMPTATDTTVNTSPATKRSSFLGLYVVLYLLEAAFPTTCPCWVVMVVNGVTMSAYNSILFRTWILWFKHKLTVRYIVEDATATIERKPTINSTPEWYMRNRYLINDKYLAIIFALSVLVFWIPAWIVWSSSTEQPVSSTAVSNRSIFSSRCNSSTTVSTALSIGYCSLTITWIFQLFLLWKCRGIQETLGLVREIRVTAIVCILVGILAVGSAFAGEFETFDPFIALNVVWVLVMAYSSFWIPLEAARKFRRDKSERNSKTGDSELSKFPETEDHPEGDCYSRVTIALEKNNQTIEGFKGFLCGELALENLLFLEAISQVRKKPSFGALKELWVEFVENGSHFEVNVPNGHRKQFRQAVENLSANPASSELLEAALVALEPMEEEIYKLLKNGALIRFKKAIVSSGAQASGASNNSFARSFGDTSKWLSKSGLPLDPGRASEPHANQRFSSVLMVPSADQINSP
eukprot:TRINITY_DN40860_c0_g1_i1.p1 TRINITY_DN40860_c0_g1~~TRINITY_DN40860_c0_g1_i1.p1  ORF type:complete len:472 (+),score=116.95 TRINITY_DN40860_c0_g1_i1:50-1465(+)